MGVFSYITFCIALALAIAAIVAPARARLRLCAVVVLAGIAAFCTLLRPGPRAALAYHESHGGSRSEDWLAGVQSYLHVTQHFSTVVLVAALLLAIIALRSNR